MTLGVQNVNLPVFSSKFLGPEIGIPIYRLELKSAMHQPLKPKLHLLRGLGIPTPSPEWLLPQPLSNLS